MDNFLQKIVTQNLCMLGAGPMSTNTIKAVIEISSKFNIPIQLIASRRQIDSSFHGGGYVNNWSTENLSEYLKINSKNAAVFLSRDHSGPWQGYYEVENKLNVDEAMDSCKKSLETDIDAGFKFLHLDPSIDIHKKDLDTDTILSRLFELYGHIFEYSKGLDGIYVELGTDLQSDKISSVEETQYILEKIKKFTSKEIKHQPTFYVIQNGTKVLEMENVGEYKDKIINKKFNAKIRELTSLINDYGILSKAHNCDYLEIETLETLASTGVNAVNIAPEYGVAETKEILRLCAENNLTEEYERFVQISLDSRKWEKWLKPNSSLKDEDKATISGHYIFSTSEFIELKQKISFKSKKYKIDFDLMLYNSVYRSVYDSLLGLNWFKNV